MKIKSNMETIMTEACQGNPKCCILLSDLYKTGAPSYNIERSMGQSLYWQEQAIKSPGFKNLVKNHTHLEDDNINLFISKHRHRLEENVKPKEAAVYNPELLKGLHMFPEN